MNEKIKNILSVYVLKLQWLIYDLKTCSLDEDPITLHLTGGDITISLNPKTKTTMNRQQTKELLPIIQAFAEGKTIEFRNKSFKEWTEIDNPSFDPTITNYRIKPEPKYRSFKDAEECWQEMLKHEPFGWVKYKEENKYTTYCNINDNCDFQADFEDFNFTDGTPFGIKE